MHDSSGIKSSELLLSNVESLRSIRDPGIPERKKRDDLVSLKKEPSESFLEGYSPLLLSTLPPHHLINKHSVN